MKDIMRQTWWKVVVAGIGSFLLTVSAPAPAADVALSRLAVSADGHHLVKADGSPFFWLADTAWAIVQLNPADVDLYLNDRQAKGFNVIQIGLENTNYNGQPPYLNNNTDTLNPAYWEYVDQIVTKINARNMYVIMGVMGGTTILTYMSIAATAKATNLGVTLGARYKDFSNVIGWWAYGDYSGVNGYTVTTTPQQQALFNALANGLNTGHGGTQLMSIYPTTVTQSSSREFATAPWLDFHTTQSGMEVDRPQFGHPEVYTMIAADYARTPAKPVLDGEAIYDDAIDGFFSVPNPPTGEGHRVVDSIVRKKAYWTVFSGAMGAVYGHISVWAFWDPGEIVGQAQRTPWKMALNAPASSPMRYLKTLIESRPFLSLVPDQSVLTAGQGERIDRNVAAREASGAYLYVYTPRGTTFSVNLAKLARGPVKCWWFNPRDGAMTVIGEFPNAGAVPFDPPGVVDYGNDWVLIAEGTGPTPTPIPTPKRPKRR